MPLIFLLLTGCDDGSFSFGASAEEGEDTLFSGGDVECDEDIAPEDVTGPDCLSGTMSCDESITATTEGGMSSFNGENYQDWYCTLSSASEFTGPERVYEFTHPGDGEVTFSLSSPCGDLSLIALAWSDGETCPYEGVSILECDVDSSTLTIWNNNNTRYLLIVDGDEAQPFTLSSSCL